MVFSIISHRSNNCRPRFKRHFLWFSWNPQINTSSKSTIRNVSGNSSLHVHYHVRPHSGVETTRREICRSAWPVGNPGKIVQRFRKDCSYCRKMNKKMNHSAARTTLSPSFYFCDADVVFGFRAQTFKNATKPMEAYALIICCILTGAVNILCLEGM